MYYTQSTKNITTIILSFDGVMTNLSKLRYNYYRRLCKLYNVELDSEYYFNHCDSQSTMYQNCPIPTSLIPSEALKSKVEEDLYTYSKHHGIKINEGFDELYELVKSKKLQLIYTSTHPSKYTEPLFNLTNSFYKPHQFYFDQVSVYEALKNEPEQVLVIASDKPTLKIANKYHYNALYYPTIQVEDEEDELRSLGIIHHLIEVINLILDPSRQPKHVYMLDNYQELMDSGISSRLKDTLTQIKEEQITKEELKEEQITKEDPNEVKKQEEIVIEDAVEKEPESKIQLPGLETSEELFEKTMVFDFKLNNLDTNEEETIDEAEYTLEPLEGIDENTHTDLDTIINDLAQKDVNHTQIFTKEELKEFGMSESDLYKEDDDDEEKKTIIQTIFNTFVYAFVDSIIFMIIYLAMSIGLYDWIYSKQGALSLLQPVLTGIYHISMSIFEPIAKIIGTYIQASETFIEGIALFLLVTCIFWIGMLLTSFIKTKKRGN